jgi:hypothetical protein
MLSRHLVGVHEQGGAIVLQDGRVIGLIDSAIVYTESPTTGAFSVVATAALACRLAHPSRSAATTGPERAELAAMRELLFDPTYTLDEHAQLEVGGTRWNPVAGTVAYLRGPSGAIEFGRADLVRAG